MAEENALHHIVSFRLRGEEYALEISQVQEIIRVGEWTKVPNAPRHVKGVINLRGRIIPVVDPKISMGLPPSELTKDSRIMVVESNLKVMGLLVDGVSQVFKLPASAVEPPPEDSLGAGFIRGLGRLGERLIILLYLDKLTVKDEAPAAV